MHILFVGGDKSDIRDTLKSLESYFNSPIQYTTSTDLKVISNGLLFDAVICHKERDIKKLIEIIPTLHKQETQVLLPTINSLKNATDKQLMRQAFTASAQEISAKFHVLDLDNLNKSISEAFTKIRSKKLIVKPSHNAESMYVTLATDNESVLQSVALITDGYCRNRPGIKPKILLEEYLEGPMYSIDGYLDASSLVHFCPPIRVITGVEVNDRDFYGFFATTTLLAAESYEDLKNVTEKGLLSLGLKNCSFHAELRLTKKGWRIIEIGPRIGGYRHKIYKTSFEFDHLLNDSLVRLGKEPIIKFELFRFTGVLKIYPSKEGYIKVKKDINSILNNFSTLYDEYNIIHKADDGTFSRSASNGGHATLVIQIVSKKELTITSLLELKKSLQNAYN